MSAQAGAVAWRCDGRFQEWDGGVTHITKYAKTRQEMLIFRDQGYTCTPIHDEPAAVSVEALEGLVADMRGAADETSDHYEAKSLRLFARRLTQLIKERSNG